MSVKGTLTRSQTEQKSFALKPYQTDAKNGRGGDKHLENINFHGLRQMMDQANINFNPCDRCLFGAAEAQVQAQAQAQAQLFSF